jgi:outer membrane protein
MRPNSPEPARQPLVAPGPGRVHVLTSLPGLASAQSLQELYEAARGFDGTYLAAKALAQSAEYRAAQVEALARPSAAVSAGVNANRSDPPKIAADTTQSASATLSGRYPLVQPRQRPDHRTGAQGPGHRPGRSGLPPSRTWWCVWPRPTSTCWPRRTRWPPHAPARPPRPSSWPRPSATSRSAPPPSPTRAKRRRASTWAPSRNWRPRTTCAASASRWTQLVGRTGVQPKPLLVPVVLPAPQPASAEEWVTTADQQHPTVRRARIGLEVAQLETEQGARRPSCPRWMRWQRSAGPTSARQQVQQQRLHQHRQRGRAAQLAAVHRRQHAEPHQGNPGLEDKSRNELEAARRGVGQGTRVAYFGVQSGLAQVKALEAAEASTKLALEATQLGYKVGVRVNLDVLNAQSQLFATQRDLAKARYDVLMGGLRLRQAAGQLAPRRRSREQAAGQVNLSSPGSHLAAAVRLAHTAGHALSTHRHCPGRGPSPPTASGWVKPAWTPPAGRRRGWLLAPDRAGRSPARRRPGQRRGGPAPLRRIHPPAAPAPCSRSL